MGGRVARDWIGSLANFVGAFAGEKGRDAIDHRGEKSGLVALVDPLESNHHQKDESHDAENKFVYVSQLAEKENRHEQKDDRQKKFEPKRRGNFRRFFECAEG